MKINVIETTKLTSEQKKKLSTLGQVKYFDGLPNAKEVVERSKDAEIIILDFSPIDKAIPNMKPGIKLIALPFTGVGWIPLKDAAKKGIKIANVPGYSTEAVAEFGIGLMISIVRGIPKYSQYEKKPEVEVGLYGRTLGILGAGRIGTYVGDVAKALGMNVVFWRRGDLISKILNKSDVVYCALPLSDETEGLLGEKEFGLMKSGSFFVTTSPHKIYDPDALLKALQKNIAGAAIDIDEGVSDGNYKGELYKKFKQCKNVIVTPHVAYKTDYAIKHGYDMLIENIAAFVKGKPKNIVN